MNGYDIVLLDTSSAWRGADPPVTKSVKFNELENIYFVGYIALPVRPLSQR